MHWNLVSILFMAGAFLLGYGIGLGEMHLRLTKKIRRLEEELRRKETALPADIPPPQLPSALRLWFEDGQNAQLELDGMLLPSPQEITPAQRRRLLALVTLLRPWLEGPPARPLSAPPPAPSKPQPTAAGADQAARAAPLTPPASRAVEPPAAALSIVEQIDQILQRLLAGTAYAGKVRLRERTGGGIEIWVGNKQYTTVEDVAESEVKQAIRAAIAEWERRA